jgi:putrescine transport system permease protein
MSLGRIPAWIARLPAAALCLGLLAPLACILGVSLAAPRDGIPPFAWALLPENYLALADPYFLRAFAQSFRVAAVSTVACLLLGYPMALAIARAAPRRRGVLLTLVILPFWTGFLVRITAWIGVLKDGGWLDRALEAASLPPAHLLYTPAAMYIGITYGYLPFMVLPLYARLARRDPALEEAAADLGASGLRVFASVTWPLSLPGVVAGCLLVFIPAMGEYVIPELLGGPGAQTVGRVLWSTFFADHDWPTAAALASVLVVLLVAPAVFWQRRRA